eukprot:5897204-Pyramimonas_sp.AAC.1
MGPSWGPLGRSWGPSWAVLGQSECREEADAQMLKYVTSVIWASSGLPGGPLGCLLGCLGGLLGASSAVLGHLQAILGRL